MILPSIAQQRGLCIPCFKVKQFKENEEYIAKNRKTINIFADLQDLLEIIKCFHGQRKFYSFILYLPLNEISTHATVLYESQEQAKKIAIFLVAFTRADIRILLRKMFEKEDFDPSFFFKDSTFFVKDLLMKKFKDKQLILFKFFDLTL